MDVVEGIIRKHGVFQMLYSDRAGIYGETKRTGYTNMERAMRELGVIPLQASNPQGKGRVERLFQTLQDRLCSELRLRRITSIEEANRYLEEYIPQFNHKFALKEAKEKVYGPIPVECSLTEVFTMRSYRVVKSGNVVNYNVSA